MIFLYSKAIWAVLNILAAVTFYKTSSLLDIRSMEKISTQTKKTNKSSVIKAVNTKDRNKKKNINEVQKNSITANVSDENNKYEITDEDIQKWKAQKVSFHKVQTDENGKVKWVPSFSFYPEIEQKKIAILKKNNPNLFSECFGAKKAARREKIWKAKEKRKKNPNRMDVAVKYFQSCIKLHISMGGKSDFFSTAGLRSIWMDDYPDIDISLWQYTRIEAEAKSFIKYHIKNNQKDELNRVSKLDFTSEDPKLREIRDYLQRII